MKLEYITPVVGTVYRNRNGNLYLCTSVEKRPMPCETTATFQCIPDGWTLTAHGIMQYESDEEIVWGYSVNGHWPPLA